MLIVFLYVVPRSAVATVQTVLSRMPPGVQYRKKCEDFLE